MTRLRISVAGLMAVVLFLACGLAALRTPTTLWSRAVFSTSLGLLALAGLGALYGRGETRSFCGGFALVGGAYLAMALGPWLSEVAGPRLLTTAVIEDLYHRLQYRPKEAYEHVWWSTESGFYAGFITSFDAGPAATHHEVQKLDTSGAKVHVTQFRPIDIESYRVLGHSLAWPPLALLGGLAARRFAAGRARDRGEVPR